MVDLSPWADAAAIVGGVSGLAALVIAVFANKSADDSNDLAEVANNTAADALRQTEEANRVAERANQLATDANTIAKRALDVAQDDVPYSWVLKVDDEGSATVVNDCRHPAMQATIVIDSGGEPVAQAGPMDISPFGKITLEINSAVKQHFEEVRRHPWRPAQQRGNVFSVGGPGDTVTTTFRAHLRWATEQQVPRNDVVQDVVRHHMTYDGPKRVVPRAEKR